MKKLLMSSMCILSLATMAMAQEEKLLRNEMAVGYGLLNSNQVINSFSNVLAGSVTNGNYAKTNNKWTGSIFASYKFAVSKNVSLGVTYAHTRNTADISVYNVPSGSSTTNYHTFAGEFQYNYISKPLVRLYSLVGAGITNYTERYKPMNGSAERTSASHFNFQITALGIKLGNRVGVMAEVGYGYKGLVNAGVYARL